MKSILYKIFVCLCALSIYPASGISKDFIVVIDAGHGGKDAGSVDNNVKEKDINLAVSLRLRDLIKDKLKGVKVIMTRDDDTYLTLQQRADKANKAKGDIFISIHSNSVDMKNPNRKKVKGSSSHVLGLHKDANNMAVARRENAVIKLESDYQQKYSGFDPNSDESYIIFEMAQKKNLSRSITLANAIQKQLKSIAGRKDNGVHQNGFWVLWATSMPAVLIELDFICNPESAEFMSSKHGQDKFARSIFNAVKEYYEESGKPGFGENHVNDTSTGTKNIKEDVNSVLLASVDEVERKTAPETTTTNNSHKRRRRSLLDKAKSDRQSYEVSEIKIKTVRSGNPGYEYEYASADATSLEKKTKEVTEKRISGKIEKSNGNKKSNKKTSADKKGRLNNANRKYQVMLLSTDKKLNPDDPRLNKLPAVTCVSESDNYTYFCGRCENLSEARSLLNRVKKTFSDAVIVSSAK